MILRFFRTFTIIMILGLVAPTKADYDQCRAVLDWIYRELTLNNLEKSYARAMDKMLLGLYTVHENSKNTPGYKKQIAKLFNTIGEIDPQLKDLIHDNKSLDRRLFWWRLPDQHLSRKSLDAVFYEWKKLQENRPGLFSNLPTTYRLDDWDLFTVNILGKLSDYNFTNKTFAYKLGNLAEKLKSSSTNILEGKSFNPKDLKDSIDSTQNELMKTFNKDYTDILYDYRNVCSKESMEEVVLNKEGAYCPTPDSTESMELFGEKLNLLQKAITDSKLLNNDSVTINLTDKPNIPIHLLNYEVSSHPKVTYCERDPQMVSTIVIHHTNTRSKATPHDINRMHLNRSTDNDPWYMVGYTYLISETFQGASEKKPKVFQGRPQNIQGAHTGGKRFKLTPEEKVRYKGKRITCAGKSELVTKKAEKENGLKGNFSSFGIAIIGNYAPVTTVEVAGVLTPLNLLSDKQQLPSTATINTIAKLSCDLQMKNPNIKKIVPHSYFRSTDCPGSLASILEQVKTEAKKLGCDFKIEYKRKDGKWQ